MAHAISKRCYILQRIMRQAQHTFISKKASEITIEKKLAGGSQEELGRMLRRTFLEEVRAAYSADLIALGHHAQDQQETFFMRIIRGTTLFRPYWYAPKKWVLYSPLLQTNKSEIVAYLDQHALAYLIDPTNASLFIFTQSHSFNGAACISCMR